MPERGNQRCRYLFLDDHKYWTMTDCADIDPETDDYVLNRALLYRDRRDFAIKPGDTERAQGVVPAAGHREGRSGLVGSYPQVGMVAGSNDPSRVFLA